MSIILFFLLGLALIGVSIYSFTLGVEWWAGVILIACGLGRIARAMYLLHEETDCFGGILKKLEQAREDRIATKARRERQRKMNMVQLFNYVWDSKHKVSTERAEDEVRNLLSHAYVELTKKYRAYCEEKGIEYKNEIFYTFQLIIVYIIKCNDDLTYNEYEFYKKFCAFAGIEYLNRPEFDALYEKKSVDDLCEDIQFIVDLRSHINPDRYEGFVAGLCYLSVLDGKVDENEYYIIRCFFEKGFDEWPKTWEQFKIEWK
jgi:hypothetical protein